MLSSTIPCRGKVAFYIPTCGSKDNVNKMNAHECQPPTFITHECKEKVCLIGSESCPFFKILAILHRNVELLIRARYSNPLPPPPCPPKLINIPTNPMRYAGPEFLNRLAM